MGRSVKSSRMSLSVRILRASAICSLAVLHVPAAKAQEGLAGEVKALKQMVEQQGKQIESLSAQVARLTSRIEGSGETPAAANRTAPPAGDSTEFAIPAARAVAPHPPANVHIVVKGESLEKIAKSHGTTVPDLQKINRISDPKRLQIGQQLQLPPTTPKKEGQ